MFYGLLDYKCSKLSSHWVGKIKLGKLITYIYLTYTSDASIHQTPLFQHILFYKYTISPACFYQNGEYALFQTTSIMCFVKNNYQSVKTYK